MIEKVRNLCTHANHSNAFHTELCKQQKLQMGDGPELVMKQDVKTRWNSTFYMLERCLHLKAALIPTISNLPDLSIEFSKKNWTLMEQIVKVLKPFDKQPKSSQKVMLPGLRSFLLSLKLSNNLKSMMKTRASKLPKEPYLVVQRVDSNTLKSRRKTSCQHLWIHVT